MVSSQLPGKYKHQQFGWQGTAGGVLTFWTAEDVDPVYGHIGYHERDQIVSIRFEVSTILIYDVPFLSKKVPFRVQKISFLNKKVPL